MDLRPYVSLDIETTGLDATEGDRVLSIGMVFDDGLLNTTIDQMPKINIGLKIDMSVLGTLHGNEYALDLNKNLIAYLKGETTEVMPGMPNPVIMNEQQAWDEVKKFVMNATEYAQMWDKNNGITKPEKIQLLTKNGDKLDIPFMNTHFDRELYLTDKDWFSNMISHRGMDLGSMYIPRYGRNVSLSQINKDIGIEAVTHDALQDAIDNVKGLRTLFYGTF